MPVNNDNRDNAKFEQLLDTLKSIDKHIVENLGRVQTGSEKTAESNSLNKVLNMLKTGGLKPVADAVSAFKTLMDVIRGLAGVSTAVSAAQLATQGTSMAVPVAAGKDGGVDAKLVKAATGLSKPKTSLPPLPGEVWTPGTKPPPVQTTEVQGRGLFAAIKNFGSNLFSRVGAAATGAGGAAGAGGVAAAAAGGAAGGSIFNVIKGIAAAHPILTAAAAVAGALMTVVYALNAFAESMIKHNRTFADASGAMAAVFARFDQQALFHRMRVGNRVAGSARELTEAQTNLARHQEAGDIFWTNLGNKIATWWIGIRTWIAEFFEPMFRFFNWFMGNEEKKNKPEEFTAAEFMNKLAGMPIPMPGDPRVGGLPMGGAPGRAIPFNRRVLAFG